jgi:hypothetical protein
MVLRCWLQGQLASLLYPFRQLHASIRRLASRLEADTANCLPMTRLLPRGSQSPLRGTIFFVRLRNVRQLRPGKSVGRRNAAPLQDGGRLRNIALLQNGEQQGSAEQVPNVGQLPSGDRLLGVQVLLNADRRGNVMHRPPQSRPSRRRCRAGRHHRKTPSQLTKLSRVLYAASASQPPFCGSSSLDCFGC